MSDIIHRCAICEADFAPGGLDKVGKCSACRTQYPTVNTRQEAFALNRPDIHLGVKLTDERVRQIAREEFNAIRAEIKAKAEAMKNMVVVPETQIVPSVIMPLSNTDIAITNQETTNG